MKRTIGDKWGNLKTGLIIVVAIAVMFWTSLSGGGTSILSKKVYFTCYFPTVTGLVKGSPVWLLGVDVGNVRSVKFVNLDSLRRVEITCRVNESVWGLLTDEATVSLGTIGFLGDKYVEVHPALGKGQPIKEGDVISTLEAVDAASMFKAGKEAFGSTGELVESLNSILARMNAGEGTLGKIATDEALYTEMTRLLTELTTLTVGMQESQKSIVASLESTSESIAELTKKANSNEGTLGKIMGDPALYDNLAATSARLDTMLTRINAAEGNIGLLMNDTALYVELTNLMARTNNLIADIEKNPRKYFKFSVF